MADFDIAWVEVGVIPRWLITSMGDGSGVASISVKVNTGCTLYLDGTAKFYSNSAGTLNESISWTPNPGSMTTRYVRCPSGTAYLTFNDPSLLIGAGHVISDSSGNSLWGYSGGYTNIPFLNCSDWYFPNCVDIAIFYSERCNFTSSISKLSPNLQRFLNTGAGTFTGALMDIPDACIIFALNIANTISGNLADLPSGMTQFLLYGSNTITGDVINLPGGITKISIAGYNTIYGDIGDIPVTIIVVVIVGNTTLHGDIAGIGSLVTNFQVGGTNTITGDIADIPSSVKTINISGNNTIYGNLINFSASITSCSIAGSNTITGGFTALPAGLTYLSIGGSNTVNGNLSNLPTNITSVSITGSNTVSGSLASLGTSIYYLSIGGSNTVSGNIGNLTTACVSFTLTGNNTVSNYTGKTWTATGYYIYFIPTGAGGLDATEIDNLLIDIDAGCPFTGAKVIYLKGTNAAPTAASAAARASLIAKGVTLTTN